MRRRKLPLELDVETRDLSFLIEEHLLHLNRRLREWITGRGPGKLAVAMDVKSTRNVSAV